MVKVGCVCVCVLQGTGRLGSEEGQTGKGWSLIALSGEAGEPGCPFSVVVEEQ